VPQSLGRVVAPYCSVGGLSAQCLAGNASPRKRSARRPHRRWRSRL
jgi:hypothetical protein